MHICRHLGRGAAAALPLTAPSRSQYQDALNNLLAPAADLLEEQFRRYAAQQALRRGLLSSDAPEAWSRPERRVFVLGFARSQNATGHQIRLQAHSDAQQALRIADAPPPTTTAAPAPGYGRRA
nr:hypothetical protein OG409_22000 [Streptomyces sp. NBC_00974]